jgi:tRNA(fMet)-specific endonuclease VapC
MTSAGHGRKQRYGLRQAAWLATLVKSLSGLCVKLEIASIAMTSSSAMLDTSVVVRHFRRGGEATKKLEAFEDLYLPTVALGELYAGAYRSARPEKNLRQIEAFLETVVIVPLDEETGKRYGVIHAALAAAGTPIPQNDMWIAACAVQWGLPLATADAHFRSIAGLVVDKWE